MHFTTTYALFPSFLVMIYIYYDQSNPLNLALYAFKQTWCLIFVFKYDGSVSPTPIMMPFRSIVRELKEIGEGIGNMYRRGTEAKHVHHRHGKSHIAPECSSPLSSSPPPSSSTIVVDQSRWANLPPELLLDIIQRVEASETSWPARRVLVACASVCRTWREITKDVVKTPEQCGWLTFPISLKQVMFFNSSYLLILLQVGSIWYWCVVTACLLYVLIFSLCISLVQETLQSSVLLREKGSLRHIVYTLVWVLVISLCSHNLFSTWKKVVLEFLEK